MPRGRRKYHRAELLRAAHMAGGGFSARQIAEAIGGTTAEKINAVLLAYGINLIHKKPGEVAFTCVLAREAFEAIAPHAEAAALPPRILAGRLLSEITDDPDLLRSLVVDATFVPEKATA